jgi:transposase
MDAPRKYVVTLTAAERERLTDLTRTGSAPARKILRARVLLLADAGHADGQRDDAYITRALGVHVNTVAGIRKRFVQEGESPALNRKPREHPPVAAKIDGRAEAHLVAICCGPAPAGRTRWTLSLLADELQRRKLVTTVCMETVRKTLKKTNCNPGGKIAGASRSGTRPASSHRWRTSSTSTRPPAASRIR